MNRISLLLQIYIIIHTTTIMSQLIEDVNGNMCRPIIAIERVLMNRFCDDDEKAFKWMVNNKQYYTTWKRHLSMVSSVLSLEMGRWNKFEESLTLEG